MRPALRGQKDGNRKVPANLSQLCAVNDKAEDDFGNDVNGSDVSSEDATSERLANLGRPTRRLFPQKLFQIIQDAGQEGNEHIIQWMPDGLAFRVEQQNEFVKILPRYFRQSTYRSFQRQLYMYSFKRIADGPCYDSYTHPMFNREGTQLQMMIPQKSKRKTPRKKAPPRNLAESSSPAGPAPERETTLSHESLGLRKEAGANIKTRVSKAFNGDMRHPDQREDFSTNDPRILHNQAYEEPDRAVLFPDIPVCDNIINDFSGHTSQNIHSANLANHFLSERATHKLPESGALRAHAEAESFHLHIDDNNPLSGLGDLISMREDQNAPGRVAEEQEIHVGDDDGSVSSNFSNAVHAAVSSNGKFSHPLLEYSVDTQMMEAVDENIFGSANSSNSSMSTIQGWK